MRQKCSSDREKFANILNSERSEPFRVTECFFNLFLEISQISKDRTIIIQIGKKLLGFRNLQEKLENSLCRLKTSDQPLVKNY